VQVALPATAAPATSCGVDNAGQAPPELAYTIAMKRSIPADVAVLPPRCTINN
jgi:hypothetical protein